MPIAFAEIAPAGRYLMVHQKLDHLALISTLTTFKSPCGTGLSRKVIFPNSPSRASITGRSCWGI
ncbi:MAG: hypothetical protein COZ69_16345 [Deltaproteobacteria bacterium CG_4_8_14_3_um_filter_45_9]|nr:MAG: hypothetical protein COZ69_16345 [Deltaproteobacteria bacterium CG_4_8_14_3_um_filter_45_9]